MDETIARKYIEDLKFLENHGDTEADHIRADGDLCDLLEELGYEEVVKQYRKVPKWYS